MGEIMVKNMHDLMLRKSAKPASLLKTLQENYVDWMHACGAKGRCTTCKCRIVDGYSYLSSPTAAEERFLSLNQLGKNERLACQAIMEGGEITIEVPEEYKLPHVDYSY